MKKIITFFCLMLCMLATAQEAVDSMYIYRRDKTIVRIAVADVDSVTFVFPSSSFVPDVLASEAVDLGLPSGIKWASCNVGAAKPEEYGAYYAWGETEEKDCYNWNTYQWCNGGSNAIIKYCVGEAFGNIDNKTVVEFEDDVACVKLGGDWRLPTNADFRELKENCIWTWDSVNDVNGYSIVGSNGNSIFLPAAGLRDGNNVNNIGSCGFYWSSSLVNDENNQAYLLFFNRSTFDTEGVGERCFGYPVRPVCK